MEKFDGKRCIITGAGRGIGRALALELARRGAKVIAVSRTGSYLETLKAEAPTIEIITCDVGNLEDLKSKVQPHLPVHMLVNNAAIYFLQPFVESGVQEFDDMFKINFKSAFFLSQLIAKSMIENHIEGSIVNVSSVSTLTIEAQHAAYSSSKAAMDNLTRGMAYELGVNGIRVNGVNPTLVKTDMTEQYWKNPAVMNAFLPTVPLRKCCEVEDVVNPIIFLLSDSAAMITGVCLPVDGGGSL